MDSNNKKAEIINYWRAVEFFTPQNIPKVAPSDPIEPVFAAKKGNGLPWEASHPLKGRLPPPQTSRRFLVYCGIYRMEKVRDILEDKFGKDPESYDERMDGESCLFAFSVSEDGRPLFDTFVVSTCAWATGRTLSPGPDSSAWLAGFDTTAASLAQDFAERLSVLQNDDLGLELIEKGYNLGRPINYADILRETEIIAGELNVPDLSDTLEIRVKAGLIASKKKYSADDHDFLNSFFLNDLAKVSREARHNNIGEGLRSYLTDDSELDLSRRIDVRESVDTLFQQLSPELFPSGRWPSKGHHPLVFSQQFAINSMIQSLSKGAGLFAVNGPPGTGKTTLLRDLIAAVVVERATRLSELEHPEHAFLGERRWITDERTRVISIWKEEFRGFEIVVASNNNGAVENVTLEIPGVDAVDPVWQAYADYFPDFASRIIDQPAWAMVAARLGNKANRAEFLNRFWYEDKSAVDSDEEDTSAAGFLNLLKSIKVEPSDWSQAVNRFKKAVAEEQSHRLERKKIYQACLELQSLLREIFPLESKQRELEAQKNVASARLQEAQSDEAATAEEVEKAKRRRLEHRQFKPGILEILLTLGKAFREWRAKDKTFEDAIERAEEQFDAAQNLTAARRRELNAVERKVQNVSTELGQKRREAAYGEEQLNKAKARFGQFFPEREAWETEEEKRELSSPWSDPEWTAARTRVFLEALRLHKAFVATNADRMRKSLQGAVDVLNGAVPGNVSLDGIESAWATLFFVIPVISTTFASFDRLFSHLGREALGWLLIDEAGQAVPQAAVGAIWRAKRTVVVGDPMQLEPIVTLPFTAQQALRRYYKADETWLPGRTSAQELADRVSVLGTQLDTQEGPIWVGSPLRVHRRCDRPMFDISNHVAYGGLMVFGTPPRTPIGLPASEWIDVKSNQSEGHWIQAEGDTLDEWLEGIISQGVAPKDIFLISPFRDVVRRLRQVERRLQGIRTGTIHTAQGKESDVVFLVLGGDPNKPGAKQWASARPNLVNVAASRAKRRLYVIGNKDLWEEYQYFDTAVLILSKQ